MPKFIVKFGKGFGKIHRLPERVLGGLKSGVARMARRLMLQSRLPLEQKGLLTKPYAKVQGRHILARARVTRNRLARLGLGRSPLPKVESRPDGWEGVRLPDGRQLIGKRDASGTFRPLMLRRKRMDWAGKAAGSRASERRRVLVSAIAERMRK